MSSDGCSREFYGHEDLAESWVFKGGTCLKKCFFETYRFSEDLDFTLIKPEHIDADFLKNVFCNCPGCRRDFGNRAYRFGWTGESAFDLRIR